MLQHNKTNIYGLETDCALLCSAIEISGRSFFDASQCPKKNPSLYENRSEMLCDTDSQEQLM